ncbi:FAD-dependent oxidoreductase [Paenibacillus sp. MBLB4367]|uniref:FAD-dependent oxidoreductase n=1 Tax=Paenibacillus sp. MBLB4367 TaxID=3384767 RepID=UPI0039080D13
MSAPVIVYTSVGCPRCHEVKRQLKEWNVAFEERNVTESEQYFKELQSNRIFGTPATFIGSKIVLGYQEARLKQELEAIGAFGGNDSPSPEAAETAAADNAAAAIAEEPAAVSDSEKTEADELFQPVDDNILARVFDFVVIGGGPAGASAAVYASRGRLDTLVIDKAPTAGTLATTHKIANYPGVRGELTGLELLKEMQWQAKDFGTTFVQTNVLSVDFSDPAVKKLQVPEGTIQARTVFIAVGAKAPSSSIIGENEFIGRGVSYCSTCDAAFFQDRTVVVAGDNDEALQEAEALAKFCREVKVLMPTAIVRGEYDLERLAAKPNVTIYKKYRVKQIKGDHSVNEVVIQDDSRQEQVWPIDGVFLYLSGLKPGTAFLKDAVRLDDEGYVRVDDQLRTSIAGVYAGGDSRRTLVKQAVISAADGCIAALGAERHIHHRENIRAQYA